jgi:phage shock protein C
MSPHSAPEPRQTGPYRSRHGVIFGVCRGLADHFDISVFWVRIFFVLGFCVTGFWPVGVVYIAAALLMKLEPVLPLETEEDAEFYSSYTTSRSMALHRLKRTFDSLDRRIQRIEGIVTARDYDWDKRLNGGR